MKRLQQPDNKPDRDATLSKADDRDSGRMLQPVVQGEPRLDINVIAVRIATGPAAKMSAKNQPEAGNFSQ